LDLEGLFDVDIPLPGRLFTFLLRINGGSWLADAWNAAYEEQLKSKYSRVSI